MERYSFQKIERKWRNKDSFLTVHNKNSKKKYYCLEMFPYPQEKSIWVIRIYYRRRYSSLQILK